MSLNQVTTGNTILAADVNQIVNTLQATAGATEIGKYFFQAGTNASGWVIGAWIQTQSRNSTPVSVTFDTSIILAGVTGVGTQSLTTSGFYISGGGTGVSNTSRAGGNWTVQYIFFALCMFSAFLLAFLGCLPHLI